MTINQIVLSLNALEACFVQLYIILADQKNVVLVENIFYKL